MAMILFTKLDEEWAWLARLGRNADVLPRWAETHPVLASFSTLGELITFVQRRNQRVANDRVHAALVTMAPTDQLAARTMLCAVQPGLTAIAMRYRTAGDSQDDVASAVITAALERIRNYPICRRPAHIAANVLLDTRQTVSRALFRPQVEEVEMCWRPADVGCVFAVEDAAAEVRHLLTEARRHDRISHEDLRLIVLTRLGGVTFADLAEHDQLPIARLRQRRLRAESALAGLV